jgi:2-C-methyl-D-erythritol 4-phosphate cytidylyltransferase
MRSVVIVAGGTGTRMLTEIPKQFLEIKGKPVIVWTIERFISFDPHIQIVIVLPESHILFWQDLVARFPLVKKVTITAGGISRFHSVINGLSLVKSSNLVGIHDAVRPLVSEATLERCYNEAEKGGSAIPVIDSEDSLRKLSMNGSSTIDRSLIKRVQTPQVFLAEKIITAYENCLNKTHTDDASVYEAYYGRVKLVEGNKENLKITYPADIIYAEMMLGKGF